MGVITNYFSKYFKVTFLTEDYTVCLKAIKIVHEIIKDKSFTASTILLSFKKSKTCFLLIELCFYL